MSTKLSPFQFKGMGPQSLTLNSVERETFIKICWAV